MAERGKIVFETITAIFDKYDTDIPISIFKVPNSLTEATPDAYVPKLVGLGPFHHMRSELQEKQIYKVMEARRFHKGFNKVKFSILVEHLKEIAGPSVRASYSMYLEMTDDVLACIMTIDGLFLFDLLSCYISKNLDNLARANSSFLSHVDAADTILAQETTVRDAMLLENQIPIRVLKIIIIAETSDFEFVSKRFPEILVRFCHFVSPFHIMEYPTYKALKHPHLLDLLYHLIMLESRPEKSPQEEEEEKKEHQLLQDLFDKVIKPPSKVCMSAEEVVETSPLTRITYGGAKNDVVKIAGDVIKIIVPPAVEKVIGLLQDFRELPWKELRSRVLDAVTKRPPAEDILIPRALELHKVGVKFVPGHITRINFDSERISFHLPHIKLCANAEVIIRNLVAYESMIKSDTEPLILMRYMEIMSGLIKTSDDIKVLKDDKIIEAQTISDEQVVKAFNGMSKSIKSTNTKSVDEAIESIKRYYNRSWNILARKFINHGWWYAGNWSRVIVVLLVLVLMGIQAFCSVYECKRFSFKSNNSQAQQGLRVLSLRSHE